MILIIESSASFPSVAICNSNGDLNFYKVENIAQCHSEKLPVLVQEALKWLVDNNLSLDAVAVNSGPGSYTGLRIGVSLAKGICYAKNVPLIAVNGLHAMAQVVLLHNQEIDLVFSMLDARRDEVFMKRVSRTGQSTEIEAVVLTENQFVEKWPNVAFVGNSNVKAQNLLKVEVKVQVEGPFANQLCLDASNRFRNQEFEDVAYFEPFYLKDFVPGISKKFAV